ncbi:MAG: transposase [Selenomonadaceae bacterium]|nr:transposase [Selenomonadaceae bacterium]
MSKLVAYAGLYPKNRQSGESINSKSLLSKRGSPYLRRFVCLAYFVASAKYDAVRQLYKEVFKNIFRAMYQKQNYNMMMGIHN